MVYYFILRTRCFFCCPHVSIDPVSAHRIIHLRYKYWKKSIGGIKTYIIIYSDPSARVRYTVKSAANDNPALDSSRAVQYTEIVGS